MLALATTLTGIALTTSSTETITARAAYLMGDAVSEWADDAVAAWTGLLEVFVQIKRDIDQQLEAEHALSMSMVGLLGRLAAADRRTVRLTALAGAMGLSLSRVSRIVDILEARELVERRPDPTDARATNAHLTRKGLLLVRKAQATAAAAVRRRFLDPLEGDEVRALAGVFAVLLSAPGTESEAA
jgi:DNA-binding MarR family transcriptional regulator